MQPGRDNLRSSGLSLRPQSPLDALRQPTSVPVLHSTLLASLTREEGMCDELYHERPARGAHPGAVFLISTNPPDGMSESTRRILYAMAPRANSDAWIAEIKERFTTSSREDFLQHFVIDCSAQTLIDGGASQARSTLRR